MADRLPSLSLLRTFEAAARHLSFKKAAAEICVTPAAVSQQIKALEGFLGVALFHRRVRALELTDQGAAMLPGIRQGFDCLAAAVQDTRRTAAGPLVLTAPPSFASHWLVPRLPRFSAAHPDIELRLASTPDTVDGPREAALLDALRNGPRETRDGVAILYGKGRYPGLRVVPIFAPDFVPVCAPALVGQGLRTPDGLAHCPLIHDDTLQGADGDGDNETAWAAWLRRAGLDTTPARRGPHFSNAALALAAALAGQGVALASRPLVDDRVRAGSLAIPFDIGMPSSRAYYLVMHEHASRRPAVTALERWLLTEAASAPPSHAGSRRAQDQHP
ncbi:transcriptional regulator GcvA [Thauera linaloolentis]|uniref:LysR family transcriptional regulator n=1 Tax=Thauera linaloolentis (strain DSM 12138 / JCM 21573 / CCUG 41526 / CIP 105981 / IAM 15112 / NBRC 102519 / 47Lol) TaxID=1123367 RepID=N6YZW1_THAL4|nr:transcriptional regulator GcvA [Thauera linaloolentis]ENO85434.1 LysR family transcriptional regulator [Thauera linaloolentis 47Lol = DSM 12138]MCM8567649.1 transcriptional regulator GcvA [Thauera linaloolentis]